MKRILKEIRDFKIVSKRDNLLDNFSLFDNPSYVTNIPSDVNILKQEDIFNLEFSSNENSTLNNNTILNLLNEKMSEENKQYMINENYKNPTSYLNNNSDLKFVEENPYINESFQEEREEIKKKLQFILKTSDMINLNENVMSRVKTNSINLKNVDRVFVQMEFIDKDDLKDTTGEAIHQFSDNVKKLEEKFQNRIDLIKRQMNYYQQRIDQLSYELDGLIMNKLSIHINQLYALKQENYSEEKEEIKIDLNNRKENIFDINSTEMNINNTKRILADVQQILADLLHDLIACRVSNKTGNYNQQNETIQHKPQSTSVVEKKSKDN